MTKKMWSSFKAEIFRNLSTQLAKASIIFDTVNVENWDDKNRTYDFKSDTLEGNRSRSSFHSRSRVGESRISAEIFKRFIRRRTEFGLSWRAVRKTDNFLSATAFWRNTGLPDFILILSPFLSSSPSKLQSRNTWKWIFFSLSYVGNAILLEHGRRTKYSLIEIMSFCVCLKQNL